MDPSVELKHQSEVCHSIKCWPKILFSKTFKQGHTVFPAKFGIFPVKISLYGVGRLNQNQP
jgi:hypothetical protein